MLRRKEMTTKCEHDNSWALLIIETAQVQKKCEDCGLGWVEDVVHPELDYSKKELKAALRNRTKEATE